MQDLASKFNLLHINDKVIRIPFLIKGRLILPPEIARDDIEAAFNKIDREINYIKLPQAQILREPVIDSQTLKYTGEYLYQIMPKVNGRDLIETDIDKLTTGLYALSVEQILEYIKSASSVLKKNKKLVENVFSIYGLTSEYPAAFLNSMFYRLFSLIDISIARQMINAELALWGKPGHEFLDGWVQVPSETVSGIIAGISQTLLGKTEKSYTQSGKSLIRAMPTRQLHITAGNTPDIPVASALRAILTKSAAVIKCPSGATLTGSLLALAAVTAEPGHPFTQNLSVVYWQGGDESIENEIFFPSAFDRIVVWGSPETVSSVQSRTPFTRVVSFNLRYGVSLIGREAFQNNNLPAVASRACLDSLIYNQKACTSSLVHYVEGDEHQTNQYAEALCQVLARWDIKVPQFISPVCRGQIKRLRRGKYLNACWCVNSREGEFISGVMVAPGEFDILEHPQCRLVVVRPVKEIRDALKYLHAGVSTVGIYPEEKRLALRDYIAARGVSGVFPLGEGERFFAGMPHDGMPVLSQLVDWKNA